MGRRRPFIIATAALVCFGTFCQWVGMDFASSGMLEKCLIYFGFMTQDLSMWAMQVPMSSYTLEVFRGREQAQVMLGNVIGFIIIIIIITLMSGKEDVRLRGR